MKMRIVQYALLLYVLGCKTVSTNTSGLLSENQPLPPISHVAVDEYSLYNIRSSAFVSAETKIATVSGALFKIASDEVTVAGGNTWRKIWLDDRQTKIAYIAEGTGVHLIHGFLHVPKFSDGLNLRSEIKIAPETSLGLIKSDTVFMVLGIVPKANPPESATKREDTLNWFKVLLTGHENSGVGYFADISSEEGNLRYISQDDPLFGSYLMRPILPASCDAGFAQMIYLKTDQNIYQTPSYDGGTLITMPKATRLKLILGEGKTANSEFIKVEYINFSNMGFERKVGYVNRKYVSISNTCAPYGPDLVTLNKAAHWGGHQYRSNSNYFRRTNIALAFGRMDGLRAEAGKSFGLLVNVIFPYENPVPPRREDTAHIIDYDNFGCVPGHVYNAEEKACKPFFNGMSTNLLPIYAGGICGVSTALFRAAWGTGFPVENWHNHSKYYQSVYGLDDELYGIQGREGSEAEVSWSDGQSHEKSGFSFVNDSSSPVFLVTGVEVKNGETLATVQFYGLGSRDRTVKVNQVKPCVPNEKYSWSRLITYHNAAGLKKISQRSNIKESVEGATRYQELKSHYFCHNKYDQNGNLVLREDKKPELECVTPDYSFECQ